MGASEVEQSEVEACARAFVARVRANREAERRRAEELRTRARAAARLLAERHGARRVWLFGSLAWGEAHTESDVDLLVEGLAAEAWSAATDTVEEVVKVAVDLVRVEEARAGLVERVRREGL